MNTCQIIHTRSFTQWGSFLSCGQRTEKYDQCAYRLLLPGPLCDWHARKHVSSMHMLQFLALRKHHLRLRHLRRGRLRLRHLRQDMRRRRRRPHCACTNTRVYICMHADKCRSQLGALLMNECPRPKDPPANASNHSRFRLLLRTWRCHCMRLAKVIWRRRQRRRVHCATGPSPQRIQVFFLSVALFLGTHTHNN
jgi:hypothetical protein